MHGRQGLVLSGLAPRGWLDAGMTLAVMSLEDVQTVEGSLFLADVAWKCRGGEVMDRLTVAPQVTKRGFVSI